MASLALASTLTATPQVAACPPSWVPTFGGQPGVSGNVNALLEFDDGSGPALFVGGDFQSAGGQPIRFVAKWNGAEWSPVGTSFGIVFALAAFDDGNGDALYAAGPSGVWKWNGAVWSLVGDHSDATVRALAVYDDGNGARLFAGGDFASIAGVSTRGIAKWDGVNWSALDSANPPGVGGITHPSVRALAVFDDSGGETLFVGGEFTYASQTAASNIARWNGSYFYALDGGVDGRVSSLGVFDDGSGAALYAGGNFVNAGGIAASHLARWRSFRWSTVGGGTDGEVRALASFDDGQGAELYAAGNFANAGGVSANDAAKWNGSSWSALDGGADGTGVNALRTFDDGHGNALFAGGGFAHVDAKSANGIARWRRAEWSVLGRGISDAVLTLTQFDDGAGPALYAGGLFTSVPGAAANHIAKWNGARWSALGPGLDDRVLATCVFDDGSGPALYAGGACVNAGATPVNGIAKWDGQTWSSLGGGIVGPGPLVTAMAVYDDGSGPALFATGVFQTIGGVGARNIAKWDGAAWSALASGITNGVATCLAVFDDGSGPALYVGGMFTTVNGIVARNLAKWDGSNWTPIATSMTGDYFVPFVDSLAVYDDGYGPALFVGGYFTAIHGVLASSIAKWDAGNWYALGTGLRGPPTSPPELPSHPTCNALVVFDDGTGPALFATGSFTYAGAHTAANIAVWNGAHWSTLDSGIGGVFGGNSENGEALAVFDDSSGPALFAGGGFRYSPDSHDSFLAKWGCPFTSSGTTYCTSSATSGGCTPSISAGGNASASAGSGFTISISSLDGQRNGLVFYGLRGPLASPWNPGGSSLLCVKSPLQRMTSHSSGGTAGQCNGVLSEDWNLYIATHASALGQPFLGGETVWAQGWFRDPPAQKTTGLSNGLVFSVAP